MARPIDPASDLRLGLRALESGLIDDEQLVSAVQVWAGSHDRTLAEVLASHGIVDLSSIARLEESVRADLESTSEASVAARATSTIVPHEAAGPEATVSVAFAGATPDREDSDPARATTGTIGGRRFDVLRPHAKGGLGEVFLAFDRELNRRVALKELQARLAHDPTAQARFVQEAEVTGRLEHPGIVPVYSLGRYADGRPYYAMHFVQGETLREAIDRFHSSGEDVRAGESRELAFRRLLRSVIDACNAVAYAHSRGVIHRDLKPENIMLGRFGETLVVDWGVAKPFLAEQGEAEEIVAVEKFAPEAGMTHPGALIGTPRYMSPEQAASEHHRVGPASDVYSLGAILYCVLAGQDAFPDGDTPSVLKRVRRGVFSDPRRLRRAIDPALEAVCLKAMALEPRDRFETPLELARALETWLADLRYRHEHEQALGQVKGTLARLCLERAHNCFGQETNPEGMLRLARALENVPSSPPDLERVIRTSLHAWHVGPKLLERCLRHGAEVHAAAFCPEGRRLATAGEDQAVRVWDISTGSMLLHPLCHEGPVRAVAFRPDGRVLASAGHDGAIRRWDATTGKPVGKPIRHEGSASALRYSLDGSRIIATSAPGKPFLWDAHSGKPIRAAEARSTGVHAFALNCDGTTMALACGDGAVWLRQVESAEPLGRPLAHDSAVRALAFDHAGDRLLTGGLGGETRLWDLVRRLSVLTLNLHREIRQVEFRPDGGAFATVDVDGAARLWDSTSGSPIGQPLNKPSRVDCLVFQLGGSMVATAGSEGTVRYWCAITGLPIGPSLEHPGGVRTMVFSHDGRRLATFGPDSTVRCWTSAKPVDGDAERISCRVRATTSLEFDAGDAIRPMEGAATWDVRRRLTELGGAPVR